jgi:hypothetical protein
MLDRTQLIYTAVGAVGVYLAHGIENQIQFKGDKENNPGFIYPHVNRIALYWTLGAVGYWILLNRGLVRF